MSSRAGLDHGISLRSTGGGSECQHCIKEDFDGCAWSLDGHTMENPTAPHSHSS